MPEPMTIVGLGECLWDMLPAGRQLGGAPLNVVCHVDRLLGPRGGRGIVASQPGATPQLSLEIVRLID